MGRGKARYRLAAIVAGLLLAGCTQTSRVDDNLTTASLAQSRKAVAVMRVGAASPTCVNVAVLLGVREGEGYRRHRGITVANVRSITEPAVAEIELDPGEYHVLAYRCQGANGSFASFTLQAGEIVNVGYLRLVAWRHGHNMFGRPIEMDIEITDWPLAELDRFKAKRPHIYAQMTTRLMQAAPREAGESGPQECARFKALQAEGKVQQLPPACLPPPVTAKRKTGAVANWSATL